MQEEKNKLLPDNDAAQQSCTNCSNKAEQRVLHGNNEADTSESEKLITDRNSESDSNEVPAAKQSNRRIFNSRHPKNCDFCACITATLEQFNAHLLDVHSELIFHCKICERYLPRLQLMSHMTEHAQKSVQPGESSTNPSKTSTTETTYNCEQCQKHFRSISGIKYHMKAQHVQLKLFVCTICDLKFAAKRVLQNHNRSKHGRGKKRAYECTICGKCFKTDSTLYTHQKLHNDERRFKCTDCNKSFRLKHHLTSHVVQHANYATKEQLPFECKCCRKRFAAADNLRKHRKVHDLLGDFVCHICGAKMRQKRYLRQHLRKVHLQRLTNN